MAIADFKMNPTRRDAVIFGLLLLVFMAVLGAMAWSKPQALLTAAVVTALAWLVSMIFNRDQSRTAQMLGTFIPMLLLIFGGLPRLGVQPIVVAGIAGALGVIGAAVSLLFPRGGKMLYVGWMLAALPLGWTFSTLILGFIFYLVVTPIGLIMRALGRDPMFRRFDRSATSYWIARAPVKDSDRYFQQF